jgi:hypothetical protein
MRLSEQADLKGSRAPPLGILSHTETTHLTHTNAHTRTRTPPPAAVRPYLDHVLLPLLRYGATLITYFSPCCGTPLPSAHTYPRSLALSPEAPWQTVPSPARLRSPHGNGWPPARRACGPKRTKRAGGLRSLLRQVVILECGGEERPHSDSQSPSLRPCGLRCSGSSRILRTASAA